MYDETPARAWTHIIKPAGEVEGHAAVAKVMASLLSFSMVLDVSGELDDSQLLLRLFGGGCQWHVNISISISILSVVGRFSSEAGSHGKSDAGNCAASNQINDDLARKTQADS
jgi:hypothetical protein